ncbi:MAG: right-handed parallel beta-helix repeat-containing protein, partial [Kiritimatiellae bacterium]|nr:right-handed parallel beta-helix repeat-containing protein [Kiritimatiellia bacterium]
LFEPDEEATYEWRWTNLDSETPDMTGAVVTNAFYAGTHSVRLVLKNADGEGLALTNTLVSAIEILPGPDFHVSASGSDEAGFGSKSKPYATLKKALENATTGQKIRITGTLKENFAYTLKGVELFGDGPAESGLETASQYNAYLTLKEGATVHGLKISGSRSNAGVLRIPAGEDSSAVSNCWLSGNYYSTAGNPGGGFSAGLVTHSLFSGNSCNYGPVVSAEGTAKIRNCIFTGNYIKSDGVAQNRLGVVQLAGSAVFENNTVYGNYSAKTANSEHHSAGLYVPSGSPAIRNNIVSYNFIHGAIGSETAVESNYLCKDGATPVATHNASGEGFGENAVTLRPTFANLDMSLAAEKRDFTLAENSSCIDRGVAIDWLTDAIDYAGKRRVQGWAVDIGACEADGKTLFFDIAAQANVVTGAQSVAFAVTGDTAYIPQNADIRWFVDGEEAEARGASVSLPLEEGRHDIAVDLGGFFRVEKKDFIFVKTPQAVVIATGEVQGNGRKTVTFTAVAKGFEFAETARFEWYWNATGEGEIAATGNPVEAVFRPGSHDAFVRVTDADGEGAVFETNLLAAVTVEQMSAKIRLSGTFGEGSKSVALTAVPTGFAIEPPAVCTWVWTREEDGATGTLTGNPAIGVFTTGTYAFSLEIANADGEGAVVTASLASGALRIYAPQNVEIPSGQGTTPVYLDQLGEIPFKAVNGRPITGAGDMTVVSADSYRAVEDVRDHGAVGDGRSDDTAAIMAALEAAYASGKPLYFPRSAAGSVYLTRKGLILKSSLTITADPGAVLANASAVLDGGGQTISTPLAETMPKGATSCKVYNVAGLKVGQEVTIGDASSYGETLADITAIDPETKTVTFDTSRYVLSGVNTGALKEMPKNSAVLMTDFSLVKSVGTIAAINCTVENITLRPYGNPLDKYIYTISPLHQTRQAESSQNTLRVSNVTIDGSMHDGISAQGSGDVWIENCTVRNVRHKGIHWGTKCDKIIVRGNLCVGCGSAESEKVSNNGGTGAMYYCSRNQRVIIEGNRMVDCYRGVFGFDYRSNGETDTDSVVAENVFDNCTISGISPIGIGGTGCQLKITGNVFRRFTGNAVPITFTQAKGPLGFVISDNIIGAFQDGYVNAAGAIVVSNAAGLVISGNVIERNPAASGSTDIVIASSTDVAVSANVVDGRIDDTDEGNANIVKSGNIEKIEEVEQ